MRMIVAPLAIALLAAGGSPQTPLRSELEQRVQRLEDERAIHEVLVRYGEYLDARDHAAYASLFATDGTAVTGFGSATGPDAIEALLEDSMGAPPPGYVNRDRFHLMTTAAIETRGDWGTARSRYTVFAASPEDRPEPVHSGRYVDEFVREEGAWKIRSRVSHGVLPYRAPLRTQPAE